VQRVTQETSAARRLKDEAMNIVMKAIFSEGPRGDKETKNKHGHCTTPCSLTYTTSTVL
jgi:hypothetical protein